MYKEPLKLRGICANMGHGVLGLHRLLSYWECNVVFLGRETVYMGKTILRGLCLILIQTLVMQERTFVCFIQK